MIVVRLTGGLGNQLFQAAAGLALAHRLDQELRLDLFWFRDHPERPFLLDRFHLAAPVATDDEVFALVGYRRSLGRKLAHHALALWSGRRADEDQAALERRHLVREPEGEILDGFFSPRDGAYLDGTWQSTRYFGDETAQARLRRSLAFAAPPEGRNAALLERLAARPHVSVHVRRGDYARNPETRAVHGLLGPAYYGPALAHLAALHGALPCLVFSDEPAWTRENLPLPEDSVVVEGNGAAPHEDLRLMAACRHHVLANSSFSWWGAWLATPGGTVVAPRPWYRSRFRILPGFLPDGWTEMDAGADEA